VECEKKSLEKEERKVTKRITKEAKGRDIT